MLDKRTRILGLNPGARYMGYALFNNSELNDWGIKTIKGKWTAEKSQKIGRILISLLDQHQPNVVAIKSCHFARTSPNLHGLVNRFKDICKERNILVCEFPIKYLENIILTEKMNKQKMAESLATLYPTLYTEIQKEKASKNSYHTRMFEAVALGHVCFNQLDN